MQIIIDKQQSKLMDYISSLDDFTFEDFKDELSPEELEFFKPIIEDLKIISDYRDKFKDKLNKYHFNIKASSFLQKLYIYLLNQSRNPSSISEFFNMLKEISLIEKKDVLIDMIRVNENEINDFEDFFQLVDLEIEKEEDKWNALWIYNNVDKSLVELEKIFEEFLPFYETFYKKYENKVDEMIKSFDIFDYFKNSPVDIDQIIKDLKVEKIRIFVRSSLNPNMILTSDKEGFMNAFVYPLSINILDKRKSFNDDMLNMAIKALSDPIRYDILKEIISSDLMNKEIAEKLSITPANVSFHLQKLINANLLKISMEDNGIKYDINDGMIKAIVEKFERDLLARD